MDLYFAIKSLTVIQDPQRGGEKKKKSPSFFVYSERLLRWKKLLGSKQGGLMSLPYSMGPWQDLIHILEGWPFVACWKAMKTLTARMTVSQMSLSLISICFPWDWLYYENSNALASGFPFFLIPWCMPWLLHSFDLELQGALSRQLSLVNTLCSFAHTDRLEGFVDFV